MVCNYCIYIADQLFIYHRLAYQAKPSVPQIALVGGVCWGGGRFVPMVLLPGGASGRSDKNELKILTKQDP